MNPVLLKFLFLAPHIVHSRHSRMPIGESSIDIYILLSIKQTASGKLLYSTGSSSQCSVMTQMGRVGGTGRERLKRKGIYLCIWMIDDVVQEKLMQHCKAIILQFKKYNKKLKRGMCVCVYVYICVYIYMCVCIYVSVFHVKSLLILPQLRKTPKISLDGWCRM